MTARGWVRLTGASSGGRLEVLAEHGATFAARKLAEIDVALVTAALSQHLKVFDQFVHLFKGIRPHFFGSDVF